MTTLDEFVLKPETRASLQALTNGDMPFPAEGKTGLLLYGTNGTGKTSIAKLLPGLLEPVLSKKRTGTASELVKHDSSWFDCEQGENGAALIEKVRRLLTVGTLGAGGRRYIAFDEVDNLTKPAMSSLKSLMNSQFGVFLLTTNNLSAIERGVISRCHLLDFNAAPETEQLAWAEKWLAERGFHAPANLLEIVTACQGDMRDLRSDLQKLLLLLRTQYSMPMLIRAT